MPSPTGPSQTTLWTSRASSRGSRGPHPPANSPTNAAKAYCWPRGNVGCGSVRAEGGGAPAASQCHEKAPSRVLRSEWLCLAGGVHRPPATVRQLTHECREGLLPAQGKCRLRVGACGGRRGTGCKPVPRNSAFPFHLRPRRFRRRDGMLTRGADGASLPQPAPSRPAPGWRARERIRYR